MLLISVIVLLCVVSSVLGGGALVKTYHNGELVTFQNKKANVEYHCFELTRHGKPKYVRGTYGSRGYFEGAVKDRVATVNFYEVSVADGKHLIPTTGAAVLNYNMDWSNVDGIYWNGGGSNITQPEDWGITGECNPKHCFPKDLTIDGIIENKCLWSRTAATGPKVPVDVNDALFGDPEATLSTFHTGTIGPYDTKGNTLGGYLYVYSDQDCHDLGLDCSHGKEEYGHYGFHAVSASVTASKIFASTWTAVTGPAAGQSGSGIYSITAQPNNMLSLNGIFCYQFWQKKGELTLGECSQDGGPNVGKIPGVTNAQILSHFQASPEFAQLQTAYQQLHA